MHPTNCYSQTRPLIDHGNQSLWTSSRTCQNQKDMNHTGGHRSADQNEPFHTMLKGPGCTAGRDSLHQGDGKAARITTRYHHRKGDTIHLRPMEGHNVETRNRTKTQHGFPSTNRRRDRTDQCHIGTIPTSIHQLSAGRLV